MNLPEELRIVSLLPAATEMVCALGLGDHLVGISHECDFPPEITNRPVVVRNALRLEGRSLREIDAAVSARLRSGASLYHVDERLLRQLAPNLILTQNVCQVCAPSGNELSVVLKSLRPQPGILWLTPKSLTGIEDNLRQLGQATGRAGLSETLIASGQERLRKVAATMRSAPRSPRVFFLEWPDPVYCGGHWVPEMVESAGGEDRLSRKGADSVRIAWEEVRQWRPEVMIISPCGCKLDQSRAQASLLFSKPGWAQMPAVRQGRVYAVDGNSYFARPGPRAIEGTELLAHLIHPNLFQWNGPAHAFHRIEL